MATITNCNDGIEVLDSNGDTYFIKYNNGSILPESEMYATASGSGRSESISIQTVLNLQENDYVEIWIENETDTTNVTVEYLNATIKALN